MLPTQLQQFIHHSRYARWLKDKARRETWEETVQRYVDFFSELSPEFPHSMVYEAIVGLHVMPSMRAMMTAGEALKRDNMAGFNCSFVNIDHPRAFDEVLYILMCGTGVGFSVERQHIAKLPEVPARVEKNPGGIVVGDSKIGWAKAYRELISSLYSGVIPEKIDVSRVRAKGARLETFGGRASGPEPFLDLCNFTITVFRQAAGRRLNSLECHDLVCKIADAIVVGGVRRSALISLSNLSDRRMANAKNGEWWEYNGQRALANNSTAYTEKPDMESFMREWLTLMESKSGERGIFNRVAAKQACEKIGRDANHEFGTNPCGEIILRSSGLCNLSEVVVRAEDTLKDLKHKVKVATIIGTFQSTLTNFQYVRNIWKKNAEEERLLGVSLTGIMDHAVLGSGSFETCDWLDDMREVAHSTNKIWAKKLGIRPAAAITTVKPSGTVSQLVNSSSGIHSRYSDYYIRAVRADKQDPLAVFMRAKGFPVEDDVTKPQHTDVFFFPVESPVGSTIRSDLTALQQLEHYKTVKYHWCDHNPSITVYVRDDEWMKVGAWVYENFNTIGGVSFLPYSDHVYQQAPYTECSEAEYIEMCKRMPDVDWQDLVEHEDSTTGMQELACRAGVCEL